MNRLQVRVPGYWISRCSIFVQRSRPDSTTKTARRGIGPHVAQRQWRLVWFRVLAVFLAVALSPVATSLGAEIPFDPDAEGTAKETNVDTTADAEEKPKNQIDTVEYRVPGGGYLTDPAIAQDEPRTSALNRIFPLWKSVAGDHALPRPWSVGVVTYWQTQDYNLLSAVIGIEDGPEIDLDIDWSVAFVDAKSMNVKLGLWLLPFLNITGTVGYNIVETDIHLSKAPIGITPPAGPGRPPELVFGERTLDLDFEGPFWAATATVVGGWKSFWGSGTFSYADAKLDASVGAIGENRFRSERVQFSLGYNFHGVNVWIGAQYMEEESRQKGSLDDFTYDVLIRKAGWTPKLGMTTVMKGRWELTVEGGFGDLTSAMSMLGYRL